MKTKRIVKKLILKRETISNLGVMRNIVDGCHPSRPGSCKKGVEE
jgi:hypothetical protein